MADDVQNQIPNQPKPDTEENSGYFQEDNGTYSSMRLMCFVSLLAAIVFGFLTIHLSADGKTSGGDGIYITFGFLIGAFAPKAVQKFAEQKIPAKG